MSRVYHIHITFAQALDHHVPSDSEDPTLIQAWWDHAIESTRESYRHLSSSTRHDMIILPYANDDPIPGAQADKDGLLQRKHLLDRQ